MKLKLLFNPKLYIYKPIFNCVVLFGFVYLFYMLSNRIFK